MRRCVTSVVANRKLKCDANKGIVDRLGVLMDEDSNRPLADDRISQMARVYRVAISSILQHPTPILTMTQFKIIKYECKPDASPSRTYVTRFVRILNTQIRSMLAAGARSRVTSVTLQVVIPYHGVHS